MGPCRMGARADVLADLDYVIGEAALASPAYAISYPLKHGIVVDWEGAERLYSAAIYRWGPHRSLAEPARKAFIPHL